ncbi:MAG: hypothetical protein WBX01_10880, partial [Nitrososphaeraceae archaeon]
MASSYTCLSDSKFYGRCGEFGTALQIAENITRGYTKSAALTDIAELQQKVDPDGAKSTIDEALRIAKGIEELDDSARALTKIAELQLKVDLDGAKSTLGTSLRICQSTFRGRRTEESLARIAELQAQVGDFNTAFCIVRNIREHYIRSEALANIAVMQAQD